MKSFDILRKRHIFITMPSKYKISKEQKLGFLRHTLTLLAGGFVASGTLTEEEVMQGIGYVVGAIGFIWSLVKNKNA